MQNRPKTIIFLNLLIEALLISIGTYGILLNVARGGSFMGSTSSFMYFTIQSNITIVAITLIFFVLKIIELISKKSLINNVLLHIKFVFTVAITITFLVFFILLAPSNSSSYLTSLNNLTVHAVVPVLALIDFFFFDNDIEFNKFSPLFGALPPLAYLGYVFICVGIGARFNGDLVPYFFLDYQRLGRFTLSGNSIGVFYYILILLIAIIFLCYLFSFIVYLINKNKKVRYIS